MLVFHKSVFDICQEDFVFCIIIYIQNKKLHLLSYRTVIHCHYEQLQNQCYRLYIYCKTFLCCGSVFRCLLKWHWCVWSDFFVLENNVFFLLWKYLMIFLYLCPVLLSAFTCALLYILNGHISNKLLPKINDKSLWTSLQNACHYVFISSFYVCKNGTDCQ